VKSLGFHLGVFVLAALLALGVWLRDDEAGVSSPERGERIVVWDGSPESIERVSFDAPNRKVVLESKKDGNGRYFVATVDKEETPRSPHGAPDAGASAPPKRTKSRFVAVKAANELAEKLAPLTALRAVGKYDAKRAEEFGFDKPEGTLRVKLGGGEQSLTFGGTTPGGQERYAKIDSSGLMYAVASDVAQSLQSAETRLLERDLHAFADDEVTRLRVSRGSKTRDVVAVKAKKGGFADPGTPDKLDETVGNWMTKVGRLRVMEYVEAPSGLTPESQIVRIEYFRENKPLGFLELYKVPGDKGSDYLIRTEQSRWHVKVLSTVGEQVEQDLASVLK
jgi:hypothetical protein